MTLCVHVYKCAKKHREKEIILEPGSIHGRGPPHVSCLSSCPLDGKEEGLRAVLKTCVKVDKYNSVPALHLPMLTSVNSATRNNFSAIYSRGKVEWKRVVADLYIAKFGDNRENLIIAKSLLRCFYMKEKSTGHPLSQGTLGDADAMLQKSWSTWTKAGETRWPFNYLKLWPPRNF